MRKRNCLRGGTFPQNISLKTLPSVRGLLKYSCCADLVEILERMKSISSSVFFSGHVDLPFLSRMFTISILLATLPARTIQQSLAMMLPLKTILTLPDTDTVGISACSIQSHFWLILSGLRHSSSVSISSTRIASGRFASLRVPRGDCPAPMALNEHPHLAINSPTSQCPGLTCSP